MIDMNPRETQAVQIVSSSRIALCDMGGNAVGSAISAYEITASPTRADAVEDPIVEAEDDDTAETLEGIIEDNGTNWAGTNIDDLVFCEDCGGVYKIADKFGGISTQQGCRNWIGVAVVLTDLDDSDMSDEEWEAMPRIKFDV
jgi:hypothetical protein